jgi:hypothetical protein
VSDSDGAIELDVEGEDEEGTDLSSAVRELATEGWPTGYHYGATRYADVILKESFHDRWLDLVSALEQFRPTLTELRSGGGGRTVFVKRFDDSLHAMTKDGEVVWDKRRINIRRYIDVDGVTLRAYRTKDHEIDMFGIGNFEERIPAVAVEMEWNNKDPFYDRDLISFQALWQEGAIALGVIVTRGPGLQQLIGPTIRSKDGGFKYGQSTTHWDKLTPRVDIGGGGGCPLLLIGIEPDRIDGIELAVDVKAALDEAAEFKTVGYKAQGRKWIGDAQREHAAMMSAARAMMEPLADVAVADDDDDTDPEA